jgi:hypothetical protein
MDRPSADLNQEEFDATPAAHDLSTTQKLAGILPVYIGMSMILTDSILPPCYVPGSPCTVVGLEQHPHEPEIHSRDSIAAAVCCCGSCLNASTLSSRNDRFLPAEAAGASQPGAPDMAGVLRIQPKSRHWRFALEDSKKPIHVNRTQIPLLPQKQGTLHSIQRKTADPGFIAHWTFPRRLSKESLWLAHYVIISGPRSFSKLLSHGLPSKEFLEGGPPKAITDIFENCSKQRSLPLRRRARKHAQTSDGLLAVTPNGRAPMEPLILSQLK